MSYKRSVAKNLTKATNCTWLWRAEQRDFELIRKDIIKFEQYIKKHELNDFLHFPSEDGKFILKHPFDIELVLHPVNDLDFKLADILLAKSGSLNNWNYTESVIFSRKILPSLKYVFCNHKIPKPTIDDALTAAKFEIKKVDEVIETFARAKISGHVCTLIISRPRAIKMLIKPLKAFEQVLQILFGYLKKENRITNIDTLLQELCAMRDNINIDYSIFFKAGDIAHAKKQCEMIKELFLVNNITDKTLSFWEQIQASSPEDKDYRIHVSQILQKEAIAKFNHSYWKKYVINKNSSYKTAASHMLKI